jgi:hypothetical protein
MMHRYTQRKVNDGNPGTDKAALKAKEPEIEGGGGEEGRWV